MIELWMPLRSRSAFQTSSEALQSSGSIDRVTTWTSNGYSLQSSSKKNDEETLRNGPEVPEKLYQRGTNLCRLASLGYVRRTKGSPLASLNCMEAVRLTEASPGDTSPTDSKTSDTYWTRWSAEQQSKHDEVN